MAAIRGFSLAKISKIKIIFSTFDSRVGSVRYLALYLHIIVCAVCDMHAIYRLNYRYYKLQCSIYGLLTV